MSQTKKCGEFHDPDYKQFHPNQLTSPQPIVNDASPKPCENGSSSKPNTRPTSPESKRKAICRVIDTEFRIELKAKEDELDEINRRLDEAKQLLAKVRYAVVHHYYSKKSLLATPDETAMVEKSEQQSMTNFIGPNDAGKAQMPIHPSLKKLLGKRPIDYNEILKTRSPRQAAKNATQQFHKLAKKPKETIVKIGEGITIPSEPVVEENGAPNENKACSDMERVTKKPRYVAPSSSSQTIPQINSARGRNHYRHLLVVGNTSKYIGDEEAGLSTNVTHKWLVYVTAKTEIPVEKIVKSVRFFLHESYKPNHVADVSSPPFKLAKRGWGEFPIRVQLHFHEHLLQKPLQIYHTLVLDKKHTGFQTMGAETIVELWLNIPNTLTNSDGECSKSQESSAEKNDEPIKPKLQVSNCNIAPIPLERLSLIQNIKKEIESEPEQSDCLPEQILQDPLSDVKPIMSQNPNQNCDQVVRTPDPMKPAPTLIPLPKIIPSVMNGPGKKLVKCITKDGKVSYLQLIQDPNNPKLFKMVLPKAPSINQSNNNLQKLSLIKLPNNQQQLIGLKLGPNIQNPASPIQMTTTVRPSLTTIVTSNPLKRANTTPLPTAPISNKITVVDSNRKPQPQQKSLLKPQVSLLKSSVVKRNASVVSPNKNNGKVITVSNIPGLENENINIFLPSEVQSPTNSMAPFRWNALNQPHIKLQERFLLNLDYANMTDAVSWLLKEIPLIDTRAKKSEFKDLFPFVVPSFSVFDSLTLAKQRNYEWLRAKYISRLIATHKQFTATRKWSTKEIVIYGRWYGYTPQSVIVKPLSDPNAEQNVQNIVKTALSRERLQNDTISFNTRLTSWIDNFDGPSMKGANKSFNDEIITVDNDDDSEALKNTRKDLEGQKDSKLPHLLVEDKFQNELMLVKDICRRHQIHCEPEVIDDGVLHRSSELALVVALRSFVEDLVRKSFGAKATVSTGESSVPEIKTDDILRTISNIQNFDFLTNKNLGIHRSDCK